MFLTGFADEAADSIHEQIAVTKELGWKYIELRAVDGTNLHDLSVSAFEKVREAMESAGIRMNALGSTIANWGKDWDEDFNAVLATLDRAIARMKVMGTSQMRIMSWKVLYDNDGRAAEEQHDAERIRRLREITSRLAGSGMVPVHENCATWGGMSPSHTLRMLEEVPGMKLVYDTGNPPLTRDFGKEPPYPMQSSWDFYRQVKDHIAHVHIKDSRWKAETGEEEYHWPGEGEGDVGKILDDLKKSGYNGGLSIEPHMEVVFHDDSVHSSAEARKANYVEYGRRLEAMLGERGIAFT